MEKRKVTVRIGGQPCSFYSDDPDEYVEELVTRANEALKQVYGSSGKAILMLMDLLMRVERKEKAEKTETKDKPAEVKEPKSEPGRNKKNAAKEDSGQVSVWDLM